MSTKTSPLSQYVKNVFALGLILASLTALFAAFWSRSRTATYSYVYRLRAPGGSLAPEALERTAEVLRARLEVFRKDFKLRRCRASAMPPNRIVVEFRTDLDPAEATEWLTMPARVGFHLLHPDRHFLEEFGEEQIPEGYGVKLYEETSYRLDKPGELTVRERSYLVQSAPRVQPACLKGAYFGKRGLHGETVLTFTFLAEDVERFESLTALNTGREMAMLVDGKLYLPPKQIRAPLKGNAVQITGYFYNPPLRKLVKALSAGSLPCELERLSARKF